MASVNKVLVLGNLGKDPASSVTASGQDVCNFRLALNRVYKDANGEKHEETEWVSIVAWGKQAVSCQRYLRKGSQAFAEGRLQTRKWQDKEGNDRYTTEIVAERVQFLGGGERSDSARQYDGGSDDIPFAWFAPILAGLMSATQFIT